MKTILSRLGRLSLARAVRDDDLIDQLHHHVTVMAFIALAALFTVRKGHSAPNTFCWIPSACSRTEDAHDSTHYRDYVNNYCWVTGLYNIPFDEELPVRVNDRYTQDRSVLYYRWIVVIFLLQAFMFKLPNLIWKWLMSFSGINLEKMVRMTLDMHLVSEEKRIEKLTTICDNIGRWLEVRRRHGTTTAPFAAKKRVGCYITRVNLLIKMLYLANTVIQFKFLSFILGFNYWVYGTDIVEKVVKESHFEDLKHFPRTAMCDLELRQLQNIHRYTVQCSLPFNLYVEKVFAAEWFVLVVLGVATALSVLMATVEHTCVRRERFIRKYSRILKIRKGSTDKRLFRKFVRNHLMDDGVFVLRVISNNSSEMLTVELLEMLWEELFKETHSQSIGQPSDDEWEKETETDKEEGAWCYIFASNKGLKSRQTELT